MEANWGAQPTVYAMYNEFKGGLVDHLTVQELTSIQDLIFELWEKHNAMIARQIQLRYRPRTVDVVFSLVCWEAVSALSRNL